MAIAYLGKSATYAAPSQLSSHTFPVVAPNGVVDPCLIVVIGRRTTDTDVASVTVAGAPLTSVGVSARANRGAVSVWAIAGSSCPNDGAEKVVTISSVGTNIQLGAVAITFSGVNGSSPIAGIAAYDLNGASITTTINGIQDGEWLLDAVCNYNVSTSYTQPAAQTEIADWVWLRGAVSLTVGASYKSAPALSSDSMTETPAVSTDLAHLVVRLALAPEEPTEPPPATSGSSARALILRRALIAR